MHTQIEVFNCPCDGIRLKVPHNNIYFLDTLTDNNYLNRTCILVQFYIHVQVTSPVNNYLKEYNIGTLKKVKIHLSLFITYNLVPNAR